MDRQGSLAAAETELNSLQSQLSALAAAVREAEARSARLEQELVESKHRVDVAQARKEEVGCFLSYFAASRRAYVVSIQKQAAKAGMCLSWGKISTCSASLHQRQDTLRVPSISRNVPAWNLISVKIPWQSGLLSTSGVLGCSCGIWRRCTVRPRTRQQTRTSSVQPGRMSHSLVRSLTC